MSLLTIIQDACAETGTPRPSAAYGSLDDFIRQMVRLANKEGKELVKRFEWQVLTKEVTFTSLANETQTAILPADFGRFVNETFYNRSESRQFEGPIPPTEWQNRKATTANTIMYGYRQRGDAILIMPTPAAGDTYAFEYISKYWIDNDADGDGDLAAFAADTNTVLFDEEILTLGVIWRFKMARGLDYAEDFRTYEAWLNRTFAHDGSKRTLDLRGRYTARPTPPQAPESSWVVS
jgi:hypothetical protein